MSNVKAGDLAYIVASGSMRNVGRVVLVLAAVSSTPLEWDCEAKSRLVGFDDDDNRAVRVRPGETIICLDADLRPINPPPGSVTDEEVRDLFASREREAA